MDFLAKAIASEVRERMTKNLRSSRSARSSSPDTRRCRISLAQMGSASPHMVKGRKPGADDFGVAGEVVECLEATLVDGEFVTEDEVSEGETEFVNVVVIDAV